MPSDSAAASGSAEQAAAYRDSIAQRHMGMVINGDVTYTDAGTGEPWTVRDAVYASLGITPRTSLFETGSGRGEVPTPARVLAYGDPDDPDSGKGLLHADDGLAARLGLAGATAEDARRTGARRLAVQASRRGSARSNLEGSPLEGSRTYAGATAAYGPHGDGILGSLSNARNAGGGVLWLRPLGCRPSRRKAGRTGSGYHRDRARRHRGRRTDRHRPLTSLGGTGTFNSSQVVMRYGGYLSDRRSLERRHI